jgi:hypothetical protein
MVALNSKQAVEECRVFVDEDLIPGSYWKS